MTHLYGIKQNRDLTIVVEQLLLICTISDSKKHTAECVDTALLKGTGFTIDRNSYARQQRNKSGLVSHRIQTMAPTDLAAKHKKQNAGNSNSRCLTETKPGTHEDRQNRVIHSYLVDRRLQTMALSPTDILDESRWTCSPDSSDVLDRCASSDGYKEVRGCSV
jgi:hypothetical protein